LPTLLIGYFLVVRESRPYVIEHPDSLAQFRILVEPRQEQQSLGDSPRQDCGAERIAMICRHVGTAQEMSTACHQAKNRESENTKTPLHDEVVVRACKLEESPPASTSLAAVFEYRKLRSEVDTGRMLTTLAGALGDRLVSATNGFGGRRRARFRPRVSALGSGVRRANAVRPEAPARLRADDV
jgi:hypothetical protein